MLRRLAEMTCEEVSDVATDAVVVVPVGSTEQHGPHLPMLTDTLLVEHVLDLAFGQLAASSTAYVLAPTMPIGCSDHHLFAAAVSLRTDTLRLVMADVCDSLVRSGFRRIALVNGHGGNDEVVSLAVKELVLRHPVAASACSYWALLPPDEQTDLVPGHAGWFETSLMLAAHPRLVHDDRLTEEAPDPAPLFNQHDVPGMVAQRADEWARVGGVTDPALDARAAAGHRLLTLLGSRVAEALEWFALNSAPQPLTTDEQEGENLAHH